MSESGPSSTEVPSLSVSHEMVLLDPSKRAQYKEEREAWRKAGRSVWILDFDKPVGISTYVALNFYSDALKRGYVEGVDGYGFQAYQLIYGDEGVEVSHLNLEPLGMLGEAMEMVQRVARSTSA